MPSSQTLKTALTRIVGSRHVLTGAQATRRYIRGFRFGNGRVEAVVRPATLVEQWRVLQTVVAAGRIVILQAANTGLTGGSTPWGEDYDRDIVLISTLRIAKVHLLNGGEQVIALPGATLNQLEQILRPLGREPHSVIGSSCFGASVLGGICNNSGGALIQRGPAYTELALYAQVTAEGKVELVNHLGIGLGHDPEDILARVERGEFDSSAAQPSKGQASDRDYATHVRDIDASSPARFNADPRRLHEASGCAGKLAVFAVRLDTFEAPQSTQVFYIGTNEPGELSDIRRHILARFTHLPIAGEYIHRDAYDFADRYGRDMFWLISRLGTDRLPIVFAAKARFDALTERLGLGGAVSDRIAQRLSGWLRSQPPQRMKTWRDRYEHHLLLRMGGDGIAEARAYLGGRFPSESGDCFECSAQEGAAALLHRFVLAGTAVRYRAVHAEAVEDIVALDLALKRNDTDFTERLPPQIDEQILHKIYYGHFFCHVFHRDYVVKKGYDCHALERELLALLDARGAEYPAEHNVGHLYPAKPALSAFYRDLDPTNSFNPGIGQTSKRAVWQ